MLKPDTRVRVGNPALGERANWLISSVPEDPDSEQDIATFLFESGSAADEAESCRRAAACFNACLGIPTELLERPTNAFTVIGAEDDARFGRGPKIVVHIAQWGQLLSCLGMTTFIAAEALHELDSAGYERRPGGERARALLQALSGDKPGYRESIDLIHEAIRTLCSETGTRIPVPATPQALVDAVAGKVVDRA